jgi:release factor glutamine methyltransferase
MIMSTAASPTELAAMADRRSAGVPLEHVLGWAEFCGVRVVVDSGVFVPRRRTELLVRQALTHLRERGNGNGNGPALVVDLCCGSGAVGAALLAAVPQLPVELHAVDVDQAAVRCARRNLPGGAVHEGDLYQPLPARLLGRIDVLVANAPYVPTDAIPLLPAEARVHEPLAALDGGGDGLDVQRRVAAQARRWLAPDGHLLVETSERQAPRTVEVFARAGLAARVVHCEDLNATVVVGAAA